MSWITSHISHLEARKEALDTALEYTQEQGNRLPGRDNPYCGWGLPSLLEEQVRLIEELRKAKQLTTTPQVGLDGEGRQKCARRR